MLAVISQGRPGCLGRLDDKPVRSDSISRFMNKPWTGTGIQQWRTQREEGGGPVQDSPPWLPLRPLRFDYLIAEPGEPALPEGSTRRVRDGASAGGESGRWEG